MDPYVYPGTTVLRNLKDLKDADELGLFEAAATSWRLSQLSRRPTKGKFDSTHLRAIHRHIFQDVFAWAGEFRTVDIARSGQFYFALVQQLGACLDGLFGQLRAEGLLEGTRVAAFANRGAYFLGELNAVHPFREGNGRTQREFIRQLAANNGIVLDWSRVTRAQVYEASQRSFAGADNSGLEQMLLSAVRE